MKKRYIVAMISLIIVLAATLSVSFAWWTNGVADSGVSFTSARVASTMTFYTGNDYDLDGIFDFNAEGAFTEQKIIKNDSEDKTISFNISNFMPTEAYTYQIKVVNNGDVNGYVVATINSNSLNEEMVKCLSISLWNGSAYEEKCYLGKLSSSDPIILGGRMEDLVEINLDETNPTFKNFIFKIEFETEDTLISQGITITNYQDLKNKTLSNIELFDFILSSETYR